MKKTIIIICLLVIFSLIAGAFTNTLILDKSRARVTAGYDTTATISLKGADKVDYTFAIVNQDSAVYRLIVDGKILNKSNWVLLKRDTLKVLQGGLPYTYKNVTLRTPSTDDLKGFEQIRIRVERLAIPTADSLGAMKYYLQLRTK